MEVCALRQVSEMCGPQAVRWLVPFWVIIHLRYREFTFHEIPLLLLCNKIKVEEVNKTKKRPNDL